MRGREKGDDVVLVELSGEFDLHDLENLREDLGGAVALRRQTVLDLSGITFLDVQSTRELAVLSQLYAHHLILRNPSWQVRASARACGFGYRGSGISEGVDGEDGGTPAHSGVPPVVEVHRSA